ncbi:DUF523 domain-containing protein [Marinifilum sp. RC60d5]|uniref:DUF523 domain-containing protein n=1 Tax=Marinifilum sp. RC60d5 TaxID=3458414 RepID=UPI004035FFB9
MIIVSACLAGVKCRYDGNNNLVPEIRDLVLNGKAIALCPEELGGLPTPRVSCEIIQSNIMSKDGNNFSDEFNIGAKKVLNVATTLDTKLAILKTNSPSCGYGRIYDGTFTGNKKSGNGVTANLLENTGIKILNEDNFHSILEK